MVLEEEDNRLLPLALVARLGVHHFLPFIMQPPIALHLAGFGHPLHGVNFTGFFISSSPFLLG